MFYQNTELTVLGKMWRVSQKPMTVNYRMIFTACNFFFLSIPDKVKLLYHQYHSNIIIVMNEISWEMLSLDHNNNVLYFFKQESVAL